MAPRGRVIEERMAGGPTWRGSDNSVAPGASAFVSDRRTTMDGDNVWRCWRRMLEDAEIEPRRL